MSPLVNDATNNNLTYRIIGAAMEVHNALGPGFKEEVYLKAHMAEIQRRGMAVQCEYPVNVYHGDAHVALFYLDLFVENQVVVEIKALSHPLTNDELAQVINYLKAAGAPVGLLFNFGRRKLEYRRVFPGKAGETLINRLGRDDVRKSTLPDPDERSN